MKIIIDPGHGGSDSGAVAFGMQEKNLNLTLATLLAKKLENLKIDVDKSLINDNYYSSTQLTDIIKKSQSTLCISCHNNSYNGKARGCEVIHSINSDGKLASMVLEEIGKTGFPTRRVFSKESTSSANSGKDYYYVIRLTYPQVETIIIEFGFLDNPDDFKMLTDPVWQNKLTSAAANAISNYASLKSPSKTKILGTALLQPQQLKKALQAKNSKYDPSIVDTYYSICKIYGIKADLAFLQCAHETNWLLFTGVVKSSQNNFAGLGATDSKTPGNSFPSVEIGVEAHIQHLYAYCTTSPIPSDRKLYDVRFSYVKRGIAPNWEDLNGKWAVPGTQYGEQILKLQKFVSDNYPPETSSETTSTHWAQEDNDDLVKAGLLYKDHSKTLNNPATEAMVISLVNRLRKELINKDE